MRTVKPEARLVGIDDAPFEFEDEATTLVGTVFRGGDYLEAVLMDEVTVDGLDATDTITGMVTEGRHAEQVQAVLLDGITVAGFNVVDLERLAADADVPVVAVSRTEPGSDGMERGLENVDRAAERRARIDAAGAALQHGTGAGTVHFQYAGTDEATARELLDVATVRGQLPEPIRVSHLIGAALEHGASRGGA
ncbi:MAG: DUF99 family protein [Candidatus Nanohaloarchaea archaeon]|nr:DUF99 family protein [Candidatus Nanohaloarchaea archaeon]